MTSFLLVAVRTAQESAAETQCRNNLKQIGLALWNYSDVHSAFPASHSAGHSWRIHLIPFMWSSPQYAAYDFDQPWGASHNMVHTRLLPTKDGDQIVYGHPFGPPCDHDGIDATSYVMIVGPNTFGHPTQGWMRSEIADGLENTIAVVEIANSRVHWLSPTDLDFATMSFKVNDGANSISSSHPNGPAVLFCDGAVYRLNPSIPPAIVRALCTINGKEPFDRTSLLKQGWLVP